MVFLSTNAAATAPANTQITPATTAALLLWETAASVDIMYIISVILYPPKPKLQDTCESKPQKTSGKKGGRRRRTESLAQIVTAIGISKEGINDKQKDPCEKRRSKKERPADFISHVRLQMLVKNILQTYTLCYTL